MCIGFMREHVVGRFTSFSFIALKPGAEWCKSLCTLNTSPPRNHCTFLFRYPAPSTLDPLPSPISSKFALPCLTNLVFLWCGVWGVSGIGCGVWGDGCCVLCFGSGVWGLGSVVWVWECRGLACCRVEYFAAGHGGGRREVGEGVRNNHPDMPRIQAKLA